MIIFDYVVSGRPNEVRVTSRFDRGIAQEWRLTTVYHMDPV